MTVVLTAPDPTTASGAAPIPFDQLVRYLRLLRGLSQAELAAHAGLCTRTVQRFETPWIRSRPHARTLEVLADALRADDATRAALVRAARANPRRPPTSRRCTCGCDCCGSP